MRSLLRLTGVVLLVLAGAIPAMAGATATDTIEETFVFPADGRISVETVLGSIDVIGSDRDNVHMVATRRVEGDTEDEARANLERLQITLRQRGPGGRRLEIEADQPDGWDWREAAVDFRIEVPSGIRLEVKTVSGQIDVRHVRGKQDLAAVNGTVRARGVVDDFDASTVNGSIEVRVEELEGGHVRCKTINGGIEITLPEDAAFDFEAKTLVGSIDTDFDTQTEGTIQKVRRARHNGGGRDVELTSLIGHITVHLQ